jgi:K+-transporting ATPase A subunit
VRVDAADGEVFKIAVEGHNLVFGSQKYALVATGCFGNPASSLDFSKSAFEDSGGLSTTWKIVIGVVCGVAGLGLIGVAIAWARRRQGTKQ